MPDIPFSSRRAVPAAVPAAADVRLSAMAALSAGSKSFAVASRLFPKDIRDSATMLYAWCRHCDDQIDAQSAGVAGTARFLAADEVASRLDGLRRETSIVLAGGTSSDHRFAGLRLVLQRHPIAPRLPLEHLDGFAMDAAGAPIATIDELLLYCWRVAGVVGVMMASIMGVRDDATLDRASDLGIAFQLTNIARDVIEDAGVGRVYLPGEWLRLEGIDPERLLEADRAALHRVAVRLLDLAEPYYDSARIGIRALPPRCAWAIATALRTYRAIGRVIRARGAGAWDERAATSSASKLWFVLAGAGEALTAAAPVRSRGTPRAGLWTRSA